MSVGPYYRRGITNVPKIRHKMKMTILFVHFLLWCFCHHTFGETIQLELQYIIVYGFLRKHESDVHTGAVLDTPARPNLSANVADRPTLPTFLTTKNVVFHYGESYDSFS